MWQDCFTRAKTELGTVRPSKHTSTGLVKLEETLAFLKQRAISSNSLLSIEFSAMNCTEVAPVRQAAMPPDVSLNTATLQPRTEIGSALGDFLFRTIRIFFGFYFLVLRHLFFLVLINDVDIETHSSLMMALPSAIVSKERRVVFGTWCLTHKRTHVNVSLTGFRGSFALVGDRELSE